MKKIMILMAERTGTGHKSAANAVQKKLDQMNYETKQIDCFTMMGKLGMLLENSYIPITTKCPWAFYISFLFSQYCSNIMHFLIYLNSKRKLKREIEEFKPDLIITVHSMFTKAISLFLKKKKLNIPFYVDVIDLVNPPNVWFDKRADAIFVPTEEIKELYISKGIDENKIIVSGFPIRNDIEKRKLPKSIEGQINILLVNPSVNLRKNIKYVKEVSRLDNVSIDVICGRDKKMYEVLKRNQDVGNISQKVNIYSFVTNMNEFLDRAHILLTKAGPNMILEGEKSATATIITGHIKGQENRNYEYVIKNEFGFRCENPSQIYDRLNEFIRSGELKSALENVLKSDCSRGTEIITNYINNKMKEE